MAVLPEPAPIREAACSSDFVLALSVLVPEQSRLNEIRTASGLPNWRRLWQNSHQRRRMMRWRVLWAAQGVFLRLFRVPVSAPS